MSARLHVIRARMWRCLCHKRTIMTPFEVTPSADAARKLGLDSRELRSEAKKLAALMLFRIGQSRGRPSECPDRLPLVDGPVAKRQTRDRVSWLAVHESACFLPETGGGHSVAGWMGSVGGEEASAYHTGGLRAA